MRQLKTDTDLAELREGDLLWVEVVEDGRVVQRGMAMVTTPSRGGGVELRWADDATAGLDLMSELDGFSD